MKRLLQALLALLLLGLVLSLVDLHAVIDGFKRLRVESMAAASINYFLSFALAAAKWRLLWRKASWWQMLKANLAAQFYSLLLPGQLAGEVAKTFRVGYQYSDTTNVAASVLVDRATGVIGILVLALAGALISRSAMALNAATPLFLASIAFLALLCAIAIPGVLPRVSAMLDAMGTRHRFLSAASRRIVQFLEAWAGMVTHPGITLAAIGLGVAFQGMGVAIHAIVAPNLGIDIAVADWCWILGAVSLALLLPITVAGIGVREGAYVGLLGLHGVPLESAVALSLAMFGITLLGVIAGALVEFSYATQARR